MSQTKSNAFKFAPAETGEKRIELEIDGQSAVIKLLSWVDGLGWCGEKTMTLDGVALDEMHRVISAARIRIRQQKEANDGPPEPHNVLRFPACSNSGSK